MYKYQPLRAKRTIRVLDLLPSRDLASELQCNIRHVDLKLEETPQYEAISYVWGSESDQASIQCESGQMLIRRNLASALRRFRHREVTRTLWADAICIDQENNDERAAQVVMMGEIFGGARTVLVWLGDATAEETSSILQLMSNIADDLVPRYKYFEERMQRLKHKAFIEGTRSHDTNMDQERMLLEEYAIPIRGSRDDDILNTFFSTQWFERAWTFQEVYLAQDSSIFLGDAYIDVKLLRTIAVHLYIINESGITSLGPSVSTNKLVTALLFEAVHWQSARPRSRSMHAMLRRRQATKCANPRDIVYSLLGACIDDLGIVPDYSDKESVEELFTDLTWRMIFAEQSLNVLGDVARAVIRASELLPSWVPDWRDPIDARSRSLYETRIYNTSGNTKPRCTRQDNNHILSLSALYFDRIELVFEVPDSISGLKSLDCDTSHLELFRTIFTDLQYWGSYALPSRWDEISERLVEQMLRAPDPDDETQAKISTSFLEAKWRHQNRKLFRTQRGYLGLGHKEARDGDIVVIALGGEVPLVLRPRDQNYSFVSECYLNGIMDGEAFVQARREHDSSYNGVDRTWLDRLDRSPIPFPTKEYDLV